MIPTQVRDDDYDDLDVSRPLSQLTRFPGCVSPVPSLGELLFPSFNLIVPSMVEFVLPSLPLLPNEAHQS